MAQDPLTMHNEFNMLSLPDLMAARDKNHIELMRREHVVGTAVGYYLIRKTDPLDPRECAARTERRPPRTLGGSEVRPYSWPCVLVFVDEWKYEGEIDWRQMVPESLYLDDNKKVPVCVVLAPKIDSVELPIQNVVYPSSRIGGGFPLIVDVQGREHIASIGCLVRDGHTVYALTNRHVAGEEGEIVYAKLAGERVRIGISSKRQLTRLEFSSVYSTFLSKQTYLNLDIGLIRIDDLARWTADVYGIGTIGPLADLGVDNLTLRLIDCPVRAYGCGSGLMKGAIKALFYRYKSVGGFEYVSDFLIGARTEGEEMKTHPGDSGTLWMLESKNELRPIAVQWGGQVFAQDGAEQKSTYALATCLSTVCKLLDVDVIRDWNTGATEYWGEVGHFAIGALACTVDFTNQPKLQKFLRANIDRVGFAVEDLKRTDKVVRSQAHFSFVPLADVADDVWRNIRMGSGETNNDENNHFADMDQKASSGRFQGKTLLELCEDPKNIDPAIWDEFYRGVPGTKPGALPFRVWQGYDLMVAALKNRDLTEFLNIAGCMAHYVGDACQPLHISRLHHGNPENATSVSKKVHSVYETQMLNDNARVFVEGIVDALAGQSAKGSFSGGHGAARRVVRLMKETVKALPPQDIVKTYNSGTGPADRLNKLFAAFRDKTIARLAAGSVCMADIWASAWEEGQGETLTLPTPVEIEPKTLSDRYRQAEFFPSMSLHLMIPLLTTPQLRTPRKRRAMAARH